MNNTQRDGGPRESTVSREEKPPRTPVRDLNTYVVRMGTFMIKTPCNSPAKSEVIERLKEALRSDPRVAELDFTSQDEQWMRRNVYYPAEDRPDREKLLSGSDHFHNIMMSRPIRLVVKVPTKNQPAFMGAEDHPSDTYYVAWDGLTVAVAWVAPSSSPKIPQAGGHVVGDVLRECSIAAGLDLYVQACDPGCTNMFTHTAIVLRENSDLKAPTISEAPGPRGAVVIEAPPSESHLQVVGRLASWLRADYMYFAGFKNYGRRLIDLGDQSQKMVEDLLEIQHRRNARKFLNYRSRLSAWWSARGDKNRTHWNAERKLIRYLISSLWLAAARHESTLVDWHAVHDRFMDQIAKQGSAKLFSIDQREDERAIGRQDLAFITRAVTQTSSALDARLIALVTLVGGLSALVGALVAAALS